MFSWTKRWVCERRRGWSFDWQCFVRMVFLVDERVRCVNELPIGKAHASAKRRNYVVRPAGKPLKQAYWTVLDSSGQLRSRSPRQRPRGPTVPSSSPLQSGAKFIPATTARPGRSIVQVRGSPAPRPGPQSRRPWPCTCARAGIVRDCRSSGARSQCAASAHDHRAARRAPSARGTVVGIGQLGLRQHGARHSFWENGDDWLPCRALARKCPQGRKWALTLCGRHARPGRCFPESGATSSGSQCHDLAKGGGARSALPSSHHRPLLSSGSFSHLFAAAGLAQKYGEQRPPSIRCRNALAEHGRSRSG